MEDEIGGALRAIGLGMEAALPKRQFLPDYTAQHA
jgi:hypothetical protein